MRLNDALRSKEASYFKAIFLELITAHNRGRIVGVLCETLFELLPRFYRTNRDHNIFSKIYCKFGVMLITQ